MLLSPWFSALLIYGRNGIFNSRKYQNVFIRSHRKRDRDKIIMASNHTRSRDQEDQALIWKAARQDVNRKTKQDMLDDRLCYRIRDRTKTPIIEGGLAPYNTMVIIWNNRGKNAQKQGN